MGLKQKACIALVVVPHFLVLRICIWYLKGAKCWRDTEYSGASPLPAMNAASSGPPGAPPVNGICDTVTFPQRPKSSSVCSG